MGDKGSRKRRVRMAASLIGAFILLLLAALVAGKTPEAPPPVDHPKEPQVKLEVQGDGTVLVTFEVSVPEWTPKTDRIFVRIDDFWAGDDQGIPMKKVKDHTFRARFLAEPNSVLRYRYNRNNDGYATDEQLEPEEQDAARTQEIAEKPVRISDKVKGWRWLGHRPLSAAISDFRPDSSFARDDFIIGVSLLDYYHSNFTQHVTATLDRLQTKGYRFLGIAYSPRSFVSADPLKLSKSAVNFHTQKELNFVVDEARKRGMKIMLMTSLELNPEDYEELDAAMTAVHDDEWYREYVRLWQAEMVRIAAWAEKMDVDILAPSNQWPFLGDPTRTQTVMLNGLIKEAFNAIRQVYTGIITTDYYSEDEWGIYDYYHQLDWIGDKWWGGLATSTETSVASMRTAAEQRVREIYAPIYRKYRKPIFLSQLAFASHDGGAGGVDISTEDPEIAEWYPRTGRHPVDFQEQADAYEAVFQAIYDDERFKGVFAFGYGFWDLHDKSASIRSKPAEKVWEKWLAILQQAPDD